MIGRAIATLAYDERIRFRMIGEGQEFAETRRRAGSAGRVTWVDWLGPDDLRVVVARADVCLEIFGAGPNAQRAVLNKVFQGAAVGRAVVTSETVPQDRLLGDAATYVTPGDAATLRDLSGDPDGLAAARRRARDRAERHFRPAAVTEDVRARLLGLSA